MSANPTASVSFAKSGTRSQIPNRQTLEFAPRFAVSGVLIEQALHILDDVVGVTLLARFL